MTDINILEPISDELPSIMDLINEINILAVKSINETDKIERENASSEIFKITCKITAEFQNMCRDESSSISSKLIKLLAHLPNNKENIEIIRKIKKNNLPISE